MTKIQDNFEISGISGISGPLGALYSVQTSKTCSLSHRKPTKQSTL